MANPTQPAWLVRPETIADADGLLDILVKAKYSLRDLVRTARKLEDRLSVVEEGVRRGGGQSPAS